MAEDRTHVTKPVKVLPFPFRVDIIIPFYGQYDKVSKLIESIFRFTLSNVYRVILVDDCSENASFLNNLSMVPNITTIRNNQQMGFGGACRVGFQKSEEMNQEAIRQEKPQHPFVTFVQSDCLVEDINWLRSMGSTLLSLKDQGVRMVSPRTNNPTGGDPNQKGERGVVESNVILEENPLSLYCFMCHRELFARIGGFIKEYPYCWYEDEELSYRMKKFGYKQAVCGNSWIKHYGQATVRDLWREKPETRKIMMEDNRRKCIQDMRNLVVNNV